MVQKGNRRNALRELEREVERAVDTRPPGVTRREARRRAVESPASAGPRRIVSRTTTRSPRKRKAVSGRPYALRPSPEGPAPPRRGRARGTRRKHDRRDSHRLSQRRRIL